MYVKLHWRCLSDLDAFEYVYPVIQSTNTAVWFAWCEEREHPFLNHRVLDTRMWLWKRQRQWQRIETEVEIDRRMMNVRDRRTQQIDCQTKADRKRAFGQIEGQTGWRIRRTEQSRDSYLILTISQNWHLKYGDHLSPYFQPVTKKLPDWAPLLVSQFEELGNTVRSVLHWPLNKSCVQHSELLSQTLATVPFILDTLFFIVQIGDNLFY